MQIQEFRYYRKKFEKSQRAKAELDGEGKGRLDLNEEMFDSLADARRKLALWRYDYKNVRPHSSLGNQTPAEARRTLEQFEGSAPGALAQTNDEEYENQTRKLSL